MLCTAQSEHCLVLLHVIGEPALEVYNTFKWDEEGAREGVNNMSEKHYTRRKRQETKRYFLCGTREHATTVKRAGLLEAGPSKSCLHIGETETINVGSGWAKAVHR